MLGGRRETKVAAPDDLPTLEKNPAQVLERDWGLSFTLIPSVTTNKYPPPSSPSLLPLKTFTWWIEEEKVGEE